MATRSQVSALAEAIACDNGAEQYPYFIKGFEGSQMDCALSLEDTVFQGSSPTNRVFSLFDSFDLDSIMVIAMDCKDLGPRTDQKGNISWGLEFTKPQREHAQFVIMSSSYEPGWVAVCPLYYLHGGLGPVDAKYRLIGFRAGWLLHQLPAFLPEFTPFVLPLRLLGEALANIRKFAKDPTEPCTNPYNGVKFSDMPILKPSPANVLMPRFPGWVTALRPIRFLQRAFQQYSNDFDIELCLIFPMFGDFKIKHRKDLTEVFVEHKSGKFELTRDANGQISSMRHMPVYELSRSSRFIFCWLAQWDFLLTARINNETKKQEALFLIRDVIPSEWWNDTAQAWLHWPSDNLDKLREYVIDMDSPEQALRQIETILYRIKETQKTFKAKGYVQVPAAEAGVSYSETDAAYIDSLQDDKEDSEPHHDAYYDDDRWTSPDLWKGLGSNILNAEIRLPTTEVFQCERLLELCRNNRRGLIVDVGRKNLSCRWGMVDYGWQPAELIRYDMEREVPKRAWHFDSDTSIVPVTCHQVEWIVGEAPRGIRGKPQLIPRRSIVVLDLYTPYGVRLSHGRFVIPSDKLLPAGDHRYYKLTDDSQFEDYLTDEDEVVDRILGYLSNGDYVRSHGSILQDGLSRLVTEGWGDDDEPVVGSN
ncbi:MAG: hypothetical protein Q9221_000362 [Calogaya cf. arnoldii]